MKTNKWEKAVQNAQDALIEMPIGTVKVLWGVVVMKPAKDAYQIGNINADCLCSEHTAEMIASTLFDKHAD